MKEVNPNFQKKSIDIKSIIDFLIHFIKEPTTYIKQIPDWNLPSLFFIQISVSLISGVLAGLLKLNFYRIASGLFLMPIVSTICSLLLSTFLYYYFQFFENRTENFKKIFSLVITASIPFYLFQVVSEYFSPISIVGFAITSFLLVIGLNESFKVDRKKCYQLVGLLFALVLLTWLTNQFTS